ncbi:hypothetical protein EYF80_046300 [Liparis tanakae]|uniref:Uncharacterized protein n=1 Tax=Liparis tanakae TaxID=230148 RepID=A0A4Z2FSY9_9TELE|nr:hypothetical protein EYF80_046300 [Liparis tanakae]
MPLIRPRPAENYLTEEPPTETNACLCEFTGAHSGIYWRGQRAEHTKEITAAQRFTGSKQLQEAAGRLAFPIANSSINSAAPGGSPDPSPCHPNLHSYLQENNPGSSPPHLHYIFPNSPSERRLQALFTRSHLHSGSCGVKLPDDLEQTPANGEFIVRNVAEPTIFGKCTEEPQQQVDEGKTENGGGDSPHRHQLAPPFFRQEGGAARDVAEAFRRGSVSSRKRFVSRQDPP